MLGPIQHNAGSSGPWGNWFALGIACLVVWANSRFYIRGWMIRRGVDDRRWVWLGEGLPLFFPAFDLLGETKSTESLNGFTGAVQGVEFICCDFKIGDGKGATYRTLIAARSKEDPFSQSFAGNSSFQTDYAEEWTAISLAAGGVRWSRLIPAKQIFSIIESLR